MPHQPVACVRLAARFVGYMASSKMVFSPMRPGCGGFDFDKPVCLPVFLQAQPPAIHARRIQLNANGQPPIVIQFLVDDRLPQGLLGLLSDLDGLFQVIVIGKVLDSDARENAGVLQAGYYVAMLDSPHPSLAGLCRL